MTTKSSKTTKPTIPENIRTARREMSGWLSKFAEMDAREAEFIRHTLNSVYIEIAKWKDVFAHRVQKARRKAGRPIAGHRLCATIEQFAEIADRIRDVRNDFESTGEDESDLGDYGQRVADEVLDYANEEANGDAFLVSLARAGLI